MGNQRKSPEKLLQKSIIQWINIRYPTIEVWLAPSTGTFSFQKGTYLKQSKYVKKGVSDILGIFPNGTWLSIEVKVKPNKPTVEQLDFLKMIGDRGGVAMWIYSIEDVEEYLKQALQISPHLLQSPGQFSPLENIPTLLREEMS